MGVSEEQEEPTSDTSSFTIDLNGCARCDGEGHPGLAFKRFTHPIEREDDSVVYTHWALCPTNGEPIMLLFT